MWITKKDDGTFEVELEANVPQLAECITLALEHNGLCMNTFTHWARPRLVILTFNFEKRNDALSFLRNCNFC